MCGWLWKVSESLLSNAWKRRWFILINQTIVYYNSDLALEQAKNIIPCGDITAIKEDTFKGRKGLKIIYNVQGRESHWMVDFDENESKERKEMWLRKIKRSCPVLNEERQYLRSQLPVRKIYKATTLSQIDQQKARVPLVRRVSIF
jgi:hypothetical protein